MGAPPLDVHCVPQGAEEVEKECVGLSDGEKLTFPNECLALSPLFPKLSSLNGVSSCAAVRALLQYSTF